MGALSCSVLQIGDYAVSYFLANKIRPDANVILLVQIGPATGLTFWNLQAVLWHTV